MRKAIVTGASGFIGRILVKQLLEKGYFVYAVVRNPDKLKDMQTERLKVIQAEMSEYDKLDTLIHEKELDAFYHLAWDGTFGDSFSDYHRQLNNAAYTGDAIMAAVRLKVKHFLFVGTIVELEAKHHMMKENTEPRISCIYGTAKAAAEMLCRTIAYQNKLPLNIAILASVYGEGDYSSMIQNVLIRALQKGESPRLVSGENLYDWIYVEDVASGLIAIEQQGVAGKTYYVGHQELQTFKSLVSRTRDVVAPSVPLVFGTLNDRTITDYTLIDKDALYVDTGFQCQADFEDSIQRTAAWLKMQGENS